MLTAPLRTGVEWVDLQLADLHGDAETCGVDGCGAETAVVLATRGDDGEWWAAPRCGAHAGDRE